MVTKKRTAADGSPAPTLKRRKASNLSVSSFTSLAHPLRQTSFPPEEHTISTAAATPLSMGGARSPSVDNMDAMSFVSAGDQSVASASAPTKKRRGRKPKSEKKMLLEQAASGRGGRSASVTGSAAGGGGGASVVGGRSTAGGGGDSGAAGADDDLDGDGDMPDAGAAADKRTDEERKEEKRLRAALVACMDFDQYERISAWRAAKLPDAVIRRLVNATVSQSVPLSVVTAVRSVTKYFLTDLITNAQKIQQRWVVADNEPQADHEWPGMVLSRGDPAVAELYEKQAKLAIPDWEPESADHILREPPRGPLRPDHLREAWRLYKASAQGKTAGALDLWHAQQQTGVERFPVRTGGRRIFK